MRSVPEAWEESIRCPECGSFLRSQGIVWLTGYTFLFNLKCSRCLLRIKGKKTAQREHVLDWIGLRWSGKSRKSKKQVKARRGFRTARRRNA